MAERLHRRLLRLSFAPNLAAAVSLDSIPLWAPPVQPSLTVLLSLQQASSPVVTNVLAADVSAAELAAVAIGTEVPDLALTGIDDVAGLPDLVLMETDDVAVLPDLALGPVSSSSRDPWCRSVLTCHPQQTNNKYWPLTLRIQVR